MFRKMHWIHNSDNTYFSTASKICKKLSIVTVFLHSAGSDDNDHRSDYYCLEIVAHLPGSRETF